MKIQNDVTRRDWLHLFISIVVFIVTLMLFTAEGKAMKIMDYRAGDFIVQVQMRPWSFPTSRLNAAKRTQLQALTKRYAIFVLNTNTGVLTTFENDSLDTLLEDFRTHVLLRTGRTIPKYNPLRHRIINGQIENR